MPIHASRVRQRTPERLKRTGRAAYLLTSRPTAGLRFVPDFIIAGVQRGGTTSLFRALLQHPQAVRPTFHKGTDYFSAHYDQGEAWYRSHFPLRRVAALRWRGDGAPVAFESCEYYFFHPLAAQRIAADLPHVKVVVMLRDPVERAYSAYEHERARGYEQADFDTALAEEDSRVAADLDRMASGQIVDSYASRHYAYAHRGDYVTQLRRLYAHVPRERVLVLQSESFFAEPEAAFARMAAFVGLGEPPRMHFEQHNARPRSDMSSAARARLIERYAAQVPDLAELLGEPPQWGSGWGAVAR